MILQVDDHILQHGLRMIQRAYCASIEEHTVQYDIEIAQYCTNFILRHN